MFAVIVNLFQFNIKSLYCELEQWFNRHEIEFTKIVTRLIQHQTQFSKLIVVMSKSIYILYF